LSDRDVAQRTIIFHFGGHADPEAIQLIDTEAYATGLATLLKERLRNLQLVFLNACNTVKQADVFINAGIKAVIATIKPVEDSKYKTGNIFFIKPASQTAFSFRDAGLLNTYALRVSDFTVAIF
jgi:hypothetical protein